MNVGGNLSKFYWSAPLYDRIGRGVAVGNDSLDAHVGGFEQRRDKLIGKVRREVGEEVDVCGHVIVNLAQCASRRS